MQYTLGINQNILYKFTSNCYDIDGQTTNIKVVHYMNILSLIADLITIILFLVSIFKFIYGYIVSKRYNDFSKKIITLIRTIL